MFIPMGTEKKPVVKMSMSMTIAIRQKILVLEILCIFLFFKI